MTKKIYYEKIGRRYVPVSEYDTDLLDSLPKGAHLIMCYPGGQSRRYQIDPAFAPLIAAGRYAENAISQHIMEVSSLRVSKSKELTEQQRQCWDALQQALGDECLALEWCSYREAAEEGVKAMAAEAEKLLSNDAVRQAYDHFMLLCKLTKEQENGS